MRPWITLFSHTGSEVANMSRRLNRTPDKIITNKSFDDDDINDDLKDICFVTKRPVSKDYHDMFKEHPDAIITLHGWMRIIPDDICKQYNILNLHPGLITRYPELKGKDPQHKVFDMFNPPSRVGCVIHRAIGEVDSGEVLMERSSHNVFPNGDVLSRHLHWMATDMWCDYLHDHTDLFPTDIDPGGTRGEFEHE